MGSTLVIRSKIDELTVYEGKKMSVSSNFHEKLNQIVKELVKKSCDRAKANSRNTIMARDL
jgi:histone H3/H4